MRRAGTLAAVLSVAAVLTAAPSSATAAGTYRATMTAEEEVPTPGPAGAKGTADFMFDQAANKVCYTMTFSGISQPTASHIHQGARGVAGPVVVDLGVPKNGERACVPVDPAKSGDIVAYPENYYANVHTADYPKGAIRGQLAPG